MNQLSIKPLKKENWIDVARIYESGIATKNATFQTEVPDWLEWDKGHRDDCRLIGILDGVIVGWAALSQVSTRPVYAGVAEVSVYVDAEFRGMGIGNQLLKALIEESEMSGIWTLQAGIFPENKGSIRLHQINGFRTIGLRERVGKMDDFWRDVAMLERRSKKVGVDSDVDLSQTSG